MARRIRVYIASSIDGYIANADGGVDWLDRFFTPELGFHEFLESIGTLVMGRKTYELVRHHPWPYGQRPTVVCSNRDLGPPPEGARVAHHRGPIAPLASQLQNSTDPGDVWVVGGAITIKEFRDAGALTSWDLFLIPVMLGDGVPLFQPTSRSAGSSVQPLRITRTHTFSSGIVHLRYE